MRKKLLTVSVAAFNVEKYLRECLDPFADEKFEETLEVLIIDDGATDSTPLIAKEYELRFPQIFRYIHKENGGWGSTVNTGIQLAQGKYFKQLDGDDYLWTESLERVLPCLEHIESDIVFSDYSIYRDETGEILETFTADKKIISQKEMCIDMVLEQGIVLPTEMHTLMVRTKVLQNNYEIVKLLEHCFYTDVEYWTKAVAVSRSFVYLPYVLYMYRVGREGQSVSITGIRKHYLEHRTVLEKCITFLESCNMSPQKKNFISKRLIDMAGNQYVYYLCLEITKDTKKTIMEFDEWLKNVFPDYYPFSWNRVKALKYSGFMLYPILAKHSQRKYKK